VNEVTLFRHFGSKEALLEAAAQAVVQSVVQSVVQPPNPLGAPVLLPAVPEAPQQELAQWCAHHLAQLREAKGVLQHAFAEHAEGPALCNPHVALLAMHQALREYVQQLKRHGYVVHQAQLPVAISMLVSVLATDSMAREHLQPLLPPAAEAAQQYAATFLAQVTSLEPEEPAWASSLGAEWGEGWYSVPTPHTARAFSWSAPAA
jgi:AcrR family transcriptional regulator